MCTKWPGIALEAHGGERGAHPLWPLSLAALAKTAALAASADAEERSAGGHAGGERLGGQGAGDLAGERAAHAVADGEQRRGGHERVLVGLAVQADVAEGADPGDEGHQAVTPRSGRWSRRCAPWLSRLSWASVTTGFSLTNVPLVLPRSSTK